MDNSSRGRRFQLWGWSLFILCALFFIAASIRNGDALALAASVLFLIACGFFIAPLVTRRESDEPGE